MVQGRILMTGGTAGSFNYRQLARSMGRAALCRQPLLAASLALAARGLAERPALGLVRDIRRLRESPPAASIQPVRETPMSHPRRPSLPRLLRGQRRSTSHTADKNGRRKGRFSRKRGAVHRTPQASSSLDLQPELQVNGCATHVVRCAWWGLWPRERYRSCWAQSGGQTRTLGLWAKLPYTVAAWR